MFFWNQHKWPAERVYALIALASTLSYGLVFTVNGLYYVNEVRLSPLELVLVGTALELSVFLFEVPTGVVADVFSRRLSVVVGFALVGAAFVLQGLVPTFAAVIAAQLLWGFGYTFTSGALTAWLSDEVGEDRAAGVLLRTARLEAWAGFVVVPASILLAFGALWVPLTLGGVGFLALAALLVLFMPERGFRPVPREDRGSWAQMGHTLREGVRAVRGDRALVTVLAIAVVFGAASESFDRLWQAHLLSFSFPTLSLLDGLAPERVQLVWFGLIELASSAVAVALVGGAVRRVETSSFAATARALLAANAALVACVLAFALAPGFGFALAGYLGARGLRNLVGPLSTVWLNSRLESATRATVLSLNGQADAVGQIAGGPMVGWLGNTSLRLALAAGAVLLSPALGLYAATIRTAHADRQEG